MKNLINAAYLAKFKSSEGRVRTDNIDQKLQLGSILTSIEEQCDTSITTLEKSDWKNYPFVTFSLPSGWAGSSCSTNAISFKEFIGNLFTPIAKKTVTVKLNNDYTADWREGDDFVKVGCQKIPLAKIKELLQGMSDISINNLLAKVA